jgi:hypothetical protein
LAGCAPVYNRCTGTPVPLPCEAERLKLKVFDMPVNEEEYGGRMGGPAAQIRGKVEVTLR